MKRPAIRRAFNFNIRTWGWKNILLACAATAGAFALAGTIYILILAATLPSIDEINTRQIPQSTRIYDRTGEVLLYEISGDERRRLVAWEDIPQSVKDATLAIEDEDFYSEPAFSWRGILRAMFANLRSGEIVQGASTITQQLARNTFLTADVTINRKIKELLLAMRLARHYTKDQIFELYLNEVPYGPTFYGIGSASEAYFAKEPRELTLGESAVLAAVLKGPSYYSPWGRHTRELMERQRLVLRKMRNLGKISETEYQAALAEEIEFQPRGNGLRAPHFVMAVQDHLVTKYGEDMVRTGGLKVITTLDWDLQQTAEAVVAEGAARNEELYGGTNAALVAQDPKTGQILSLVGSRNYFAQEREGNFDVASQGLRQPGSTLKPFAYMTAFQKGYRPETLLMDVPTEFRAGGACPAIPDLDSSSSYCFHPHNFDGTFRGPVAMKTALAQSMNVPAVQTLYLTSIPAVLNTLRSFGVSTLDAPDRYGLSLVLGGGEVRLADLTGAYATLATEGVRHEQTFILEIRDGKNNLLETYADKAERVVEPEYPRLINDILSDTDLRAGLFGASLSLTVFPGHDVALKTGTTNDYRDAWAMGYTPALAAGVWAGNNDNSAMHRRGSSLLAAVPIWNSFMKEALKKVPPEGFARPENTPTAKPILAGFLPDAAPHSILYYVDRSNPTGPAPTSPGQDPQFANWEAATLLWAAAHPGAFEAYRAQADAGGTISFLVPSSGSYAAGAVVVDATVLGQGPFDKVTLRWNGQVIREWPGPLTAPYRVALEFTAPNLELQNLLVLEASAAGRTFKGEAIVYAR